MDAKLIELLNALLADLTVGTRQVQLLLISTKDQEFTTLRGYLQDLYWFLDSNTGRIMEQIRIQEAFPQASLTETLQLATLKDRVYDNMLDGENAASLAVDIVTFVKLAAEKVMMRVESTKVMGLYAFIPDMIGECDKSLHFLKNSLSKGVNPPNHKTNPTVVTKSFEPLCKFYDDEQLVFGWASIAKNVDGSRPLDWQDDILDAEDLEPAVYDYVLKFGVSNEMHVPGTDNGKLVESIIFTKEKMASLGIPEGLLPEGWWVGYKIYDREVYLKVKTGIYKMFSIEGSAERVKEDNNGN